MRNLVLLLLLSAMVWPSGDSEAQTTTRVRVRVVAHDAKVIGDGVGGARITIRDATTGVLLARGTQRGGTGSTTALVLDPISRGEAVYNLDGAALFETSLQLTEPTLVEVEAEGPLDHEHAMRRTAKTLLLVPGEDILGNGVLLVLNGFVVELLAPEGLDGAPRTVAVTARVRMMCGCTLEPGGLWDASRVRVVARLYRAGEILREVPLSYIGEPSMFRGEISFADSHRGAELIVLALDPERANFGMSKPVTYSPY